MTIANFTLIPQLVSPEEPEFATIISQSEGMKKQYQSLADIPVLRYKLSFKNMADNDFWILYNHYIACKGPYDFFAWISVPTYIKAYQGNNIAFSFAALNQTVRSWYGMAAAPNGDIYVSVSGGDIYKSTAGAGNFIALNQTARDWRSMAAAPNGDIYVCVNSTDIYKSTISSLTGRWVIGSFHFNPNPKSWDAEIVFEKAI